MRTPYRTLVAVLLSLSVALPACFPVTRMVPREQNQAIRVTSEPPGALITVIDEDGSRVVGRAPVQMVEVYAVVEQRTHKGSCAGAGALEGARIGLDSGDHETAGVLALVGAGLGAMVGAAACAEADGVVAVEGRDVLVQASLEGYHPVQVSIQVPKRNSGLHFELVPLPGRSSGPAVPRVHAGETLVVFNPVDSAGRMDSLSLDSLGALLTEGIAAGGRFEVADHHDMLRVLHEIHAGSPGDCLDAACRIALARRLSAGYLLHTRLVRTDERCLSASSLVDLATGVVIDAASEESGCRREDLQAAMSGIANRIAARSGRRATSPPPADWRSAGEESSPDPATSGPASSPAIAPGGGSGFPIEPVP